MNYWWFNASTSTEKDFLIILGDLNLGLIILLLANSTFAEHFNLKIVLMNWQYSRISEELDMWAIQAHADIYTCASALNNFIIIGTVTVETFRGNERGALNNECEEPRYMGRQAFEVT